MGSKLLQICFSAVGLVAFSIATGGWLESAAAKSSLESACPAPPRGFHQGTNSNIETVSFVSERSSYQMEIASAFAPRSSNLATSYCLRYEAENTTSSSEPSNGRIDRFYWPIVEMAVEKFEVGSKFRQSLMQSGPGARPPILTPVELYAFKNASFKSTAYKLSAVDQKNIHEPSVVRIKDTSKNVASTDVRVAQGLSAQLFLNRDQAPIGAIWEKDNIRVIATTALNPSNPTNSISVEIEKMGAETIEYIYAPFAQALFYSKNSSDLPRLLAEFRQSRVQFTDNTAAFSNKMATFDLRSPDTQIHVINQPVILSFTDGNRVCFLAPTYSPVPIPANYQTCDPNVVFGAR